MNYEPTVEDLTRPFEPYIKRYGYMYVHFRNGKAIMSKEWGELVKKLWKGDLEAYNHSVDEWCQKHCK